MKESSFYLEFQVFCSGTVMPLKISQNGFVSRQLHFIKNSMKLSELTEATAEMTTLLSAY